MSEDDEPKPNITLWREMEADRLIPDTDGTPRVPKRVAALRGFLGDCPRCGEAKLFRTYLKQVEACPACGAAWGEIRADDGPAWGTMMVVGHLLALVFHIVIFRMALGPIAASLVLCAVATIASLLLLPRMKGLFLGWIWRTGSLF